MAAIQTLLQQSRIQRPLASAQNLQRFLVAESRRWLARDPTFQAKRAVANCKRIHWDTFQPVQDELAEAEAAWILCEGRERLELVEAVVNSRQQGIQGISDFLDAPKKGSSPSKIENARVKLAEFQHDLAEKRNELEYLQATTPEWVRLVEARARYEVICERIGLHELQEEAQRVEHFRGNTVRRVGAEFEAVGESATADVIARSICEREGIDATSVIVLRGVTLGLAKAEIDVLVCVPSDRASVSVARKGGPVPQPVDTLALAEVKNNPNDLGYAVEKYTETVAWLSGDTQGYDPAEWRTNYYTTGHFSKPYLYITEDQTKCYEFSVESFQRFHRVHEVDKQPPPGVYLITRPRQLLGLSSKALAPLQNKAATDVPLICALEALGDHPERDDGSEDVKHGPASDTPRINREDDYDWDGLLQWIREKETGLSTEEALGLYANPEFASRILLLS